MRKSQTFTNLAAALVAAWASVPPGSCVGRKVWQHKDSGLYVLAPTAFGSYSSAFSTVAHVYPF